METRKAKIIAALEAFIDQRPGLDFRNYGDVSAYRADSRKATQQLHDAQALLRQVELRDLLTADMLEEAFKRAFSGRLSWNGKELDYCTGQYWCLEYRAAVCAVLASAMWDYWAPDYNDAAAIRQAAKNNFGRGIAKRWFN